jgi:lysophospholipase L1-like esterase
MPVLRYSLNGGAFTDVQLAPSQTSLVLSASLTPTTTYSVELYFRQSSQTNSYGDVAGSSGVSPTNVVRINGVTIDGSASVSPAALRSKRMLIYGDSITQGCHANTDGSDDATVSFACDIALALGAEYGQLGYGGSGWTVSGGSNAPAFDTFYATHSIGRSRSFAGLDYIAVIHGGNDLRGGVAGSAIQSACGAWLTAMRAAAGPSTILFVIVECMGAYEGNLSAAVAAYKASSGDANVCFIDATSLFPAGVFSIAFNYSGNPFQWTYDGVHPLAFGHARIGAAYAKQIGAAMGGGTTLAGYSRARVVNG